MPEIRKIDAEDDGIRLRRGIFAVDAGGAYALRGKQGGQRQARGAAADDQHVITVGRLFFRCAFLHGLPTLAG